MDHAVVVGGSIAGLATAAALGELCDRVTVVERDPLPDEPTTRQGVPQGRQIHVALPLGVSVLDQLLPGFERELGAEGCPTFDWVRDAPWFGSEGWRARASSDVQLIGFPRPLFEYVVRRRVRALANVEFVQGMVDGLLSREDGARVAGVSVSKPSATEIEADLVVDAGGRGSKSPKWLERLGYERPGEQHVRAHFGYASRLVRVPDGAMPGDVRGLITMPYPGHSKGGLIMPADNGRHTLCAIGAVKDYPPGGEEEFLEFLRQAPSPLLAQIAERAEPVTEITTYRHPGNQLRLWAGLARRPRGFVPIGDAVASFNPIYGQGMTVAAIEATMLRDRIRSLDGDLDRLPEAFMADLEDAVAFPYGMATTADSAYPETEFIDAERAPAESAAFFAGLERLASEDPEVSRRILRALGWFEGDLLEAPELLAKVEERVASGRVAAHPDPQCVPDVISA